MSIPDLIIPGLERRRLIRAFVVCFIWVYFLASCGSNSPKTLPQGIQRPVVDVALSGDPSQEKLFSDAERFLITKCMSRSGQVYLDKGQTAIDTEPQRPFGIENEAQVAPPTTVPLKEPSVSAAYSAALQGSERDQITIKLPDSEITLPGSGCIAEADRQLQGGDDGRRHRVSMLAVLRQIQQDAYSKVTGKKEFISLQKNWRSCMKDAGLGGLDSPTAVDPNNRDVAEQDLKCKEKTDFIPVAYAMVNAEESSALDAHPGAISEWNKFFASQTEAAKAVLQGSPVSS